LGQGLGAGSGRVELEKVQKGQIGIETAVVVRLDALEGIGENNGIIVHLGMILTAQIVGEFLRPVGCRQKWVVEKENLSELPLVDSEETLYFCPTVED
jgi:hypothetical protein